MHAKTRKTPKGFAEYNVGSLVSILLDGLRETADVVAVLERDSALDGRTRQVLAEHVGRLAKLVVDAEVFNRTLQVRLNNIVASSASLQADLSRRLRDGG